MKKNIFVALVIALIMVYTTFLASAATFSDTIKYEIPNQTEASSNLNLINNDLNNNLTLLQGSPYIELKDKNTQVIVGKQNNILGDGLIANTSGICGVRTAFKVNSGSVNLLYGNDGQEVIAADVATNFKKYNNLNIEALYFKTDNSFFGIKISNKISKSIMLSAETSENLTTQAKGYLFTTQYGDAEQLDKTDLSVSYRYVEPTAISDSSVNTTFVDSKGVRFQTDYKIADNLTLKAFQEFVQGQDKSIKNASNITLTGVF